MKNGHLKGFNGIWRDLISLSGCWYTYPSEKYEFVSWDDDIPNKLFNVVKTMPWTTYDWEW